ncbi:MAG: hypothetical protein ACRDEB_08990, partial [Chitinophagaceae bacterium]
MEDNFNNRDFEQFVKQNADQYRMFPSEKVWKNIYHSMHIKRRWYGLGLIILLLSAGIVTWVMLSHSFNDNGSLTEQSQNSLQKSQSKQKNKTTPIFIAAEKQATDRIHFTSPIDNIQKNIINNFSDNNFQEELANMNINPDRVLSANNESLQVPATTLQHEIPGKYFVINNKSELSLKPDVSAGFLQSNNTSQVISENNTVNIPEQEAKQEIKNADKYPLSIESVVNSYKYKLPGKKLSWEIFITPTISYRDLKENKAFINSAQANNNLNNNNAVAGINSLVTHKPDMGLQLGFKGGYPLAKNIKITAGMQFNVSKYDIRASFSPGEVATIALNIGTGANSVSTISNYRNSGDSKADWLRNLYFSASIPVGIELKLSGNNKTEFGIAGTIQPTYI